MKIAKGHQQAVFTEDQLSKYNKGLQNITPTQINFKNVDSKIERKSMANFISKMLGLKKMSKTGKRISTRQGMCFYPHNYVGKRSGIFECIDWETGYRVTDKYISEAYDHFYKVRRDHLHSIKLYRWIKTDSLTIGIEIR